jgi:SAM-dependent methyltransferase
MNEPRIPTYGSSLHYSGESGAKYLAWQDALGKINGEINARKFKDINFSDCVVLDFGSGTGNLLNCIDAKGKIAVEINQDAHELIVKRGIVAYSNIEDVPSATIDFVISNHALEHVPFPIQALREMKRTLKPGGFLLLVVPIDDWRNQKKYDLNDINHHLNTWTPLLLGNSLKEAGFSVDEHSTEIITRAWFPGYHKFYRLPGFDFACYVYAIVRRRRQLFAKVKNS